jgi:hypothetical protein
LPFTIAVEERRDESIGRDSIRNPIQADENMTYEWPNLAQQRAFAYAAKPFAATSFLASAFAMYYLLILNREKLKRVYHRIMLSAFFCCASLSFALFWGTWVSCPHYEYQLTKTVL